MTSPGEPAARGAVATAAWWASRWSALLVLTLGVAAAVGVAVFVGVGQVVAAVVSVGAGGFALILAVWCVLLAVLGTAWFAGAPSSPVRLLPAFVWGRFVREGAADLLPLSQIGGVVAGARAAIALGAAAPAVWAALVVDVTAEVGSQVVYTLGGVVGLVWRLTGGDVRAAASHARVLWAAGGLLMAGAVLLAAIVLLQRRGVAAFGALAGRILPGAEGHAQAVTEELDRVWRRRDRVVLATCLHAVGWVGSAAVSWLALRLMGAPLTFPAVLIVEALLAAAKTFGFAIPGALGVQEGAYALIGPLFGLPAHTALALSFLKRARDVAVGAPVLLAWNALEGRGLLSPRRAPPSPPAAAAAPGAAPGSPPP